MPHKYPGVDGYCFCDHIALADGQRFNAYCCGTAFPGDPAGFEAHRKAAHRSKGVGEHTVGPPPPDARKPWRAVIRSRKPLSAEALNASVRPLTIDPCDMKVLW